MAIRRLNFTGRKKLHAKDTQILLVDQSDGHVRFEANISLQDYGLPKDALVFVEAQRQTTFMRFPFGTVERVQPQASCELEEFDSSEGVLFRVKVTSPGQPKGVLLAEADKIQPRRPEDDEEDRIPLLPVKPDADLGEVVYRIDFSDRPILHINSKIGDWQALARDPLFTSLVYPQVLQEVLTRIVRVEAYTDTEDEDDWRSQWLSFATRLPGTPSLPEREDADALDLWVIEAVASYGRSFRFMECFKHRWMQEEVT